MPPFPSRLAACLLGLAALSLASVSLRADEPIEAVSSRVSSDYVRTKLPDGSFQPEGYAFGKGGYWSGPIDDKSIDRMGFMEIAHTIAGPLAAQGYVPSRDPRATKLLIMVYWGTTYAPEHASDSPLYNHLSDAIQAAFVSKQEHDPVQVTEQFEDAEMAAYAQVQKENHRRDVADGRNASMLGYDSWWEATFTAPAGTPLEQRKRDMMSELEEDRYFVVLMAYDFQMMWKDKKRKLLWETRFSISEHRNEFDKQLPAMALEASRFFGRDSHGLTHRDLPEGRVDVGEVRNLGTVPEK